MSRDDFCACYLDEFEAIAGSWREFHETEHRQSWEQCRTLAAIYIQPHVKKRITPRQLLPFPWDRKEQEVAKTAESKFTAEQRLQRFERLKSKVI